MTREEFLSCLVRQAGGAKPLSREEEARLGNMIQHGTSGWRRFAIDKLVLHNVRYAILSATRFSGYGQDVNDMTQDGIIGLYEAAEKFDPDRGFKFITYARLYVKQRIQRGLASAGFPVAVPPNTLGYVSQTSRALDRLFSEGNRDPSVEQLAGEAGVQLSHAGSYMAAKKHALALDDSPYRESSRARGDTSRKEMLADELPPPCAGVEASDTSRSIQRILDGLTAREAEVIRLVYGLDGKEPITLEKAGVVIGVTRERVRQIRNAATKKMLEYGNPEIIASLGMEVGLDRQAVEELCAESRSDSANKRSNYCARDRIKMKKYWDRKRREKATWLK